LLVDSGQLFLIDCATTGCVKFSKYRNISEFELRLQKLQQAWLKAREVDALQVFNDEAKELKKFEKLGVAT
jgi:uncharacterized protein YecT (DUF1311 family)